LSDRADLEKKAIEAQRHYRKALARVESQEQAKASAQRALTRLLPDLERAILEGCAPSVKDNLFQTGLGAVSRSNEAWDALSKATTTLEVARQTLVSARPWSPWSSNWDIFQAYRRLRQFPGPSGIAQIVVDRFQTQTRGLSTCCVRRLACYRAGWHRRPAARRDADYRQAPKAPSSTRAGGFRPWACP